VARRTRCQRRTPHLLRGRDGDGDPRLRAPRGRRGRLEVGLGGEYDATSAVDPVATAVTNVSLEHTAVLGDTIAEIARTKARIADAGVPLVTACEGEALSVVREVANDAGAPIATVARASGSSGNGETDDQTLSVAYEGRVSPTDAEVTLAGEVDGTYRIPLVGDHQATNAGIAVALARRTAGALGNGTDASLPDEAVRDGLARATWPGRFEVVDTAPLTVLDGAHNPAACRTLAGTLAEYDYDDLHLVYGAMHDKDHVGAASALPDADSAVTCRPDLDRAEDPEVLAAALRTAGVDDVTAGDDVAAALETAVERADLGGDCVLLVGSLFAVAEARAARMRTVTLGPSAGATRTRTQRARWTSAASQPATNPARADGDARGSTTASSLSDCAATARSAHGRPPRGRRRRRDRGPRPARVASRAASTSPSRLRERWGVPRAARPAPRARG